MKIVKWTEWDDPNYKEMFPLGTAYDSEKYDEAISVIAKELRENGYKFDGHYHQNGDFGVPVFDTGEVFQCTQRCWGAIMVEAYPDEIDNSDGYGYCDWAWIAPEEMVVPVEKNVLTAG